MIVDIEKMSYDEIRSSLILAKELLRQLSERAPDNLCFRSYSGAYLAVADAVSTLSRVQVISEDNQDETV